MTKSKRIDRLALMIVDEVIGVLCKNVNEELKDVDKQRENMLFVELFEQIKEEIEQYEWAVERNHLTPSEN